jgi:hypothetical protein
MATMPLACLFMAIAAFLHAFRPSNRNEPGSMGGH